MIRRFLLSLAAMLLLPLSAWAQGDNGSPCPIGAASPRTIATSTYTLVNDDQCAVLVFSSASPISVTVPAGSMLTPGFQAKIIASGNTVTLTPSSGTINGASSATIPSGADGVLYGNGAAAFRLMGGGSSGGMAITASNATLPTARDNLMPTANTNIVYATDAKGAVSNALCTWDGGTGHDVGDCVNGAIATAAANGGGTVIVPAGTYYFTTKMSNSTSGVQLAGAGWGIPRDTATPGNFLSVTRLIYNGSAGAGPGYYDGIGAGAHTLYGAGIQGITFDCGDLLNTCVHVQQVLSSQFYFGQAEAVNTGILFDTTSTDTGGNQNNDIWVETRNLGASNTSTATGIIFDSGSGASFNTSYNRIHYASAAYAGGDGIVFGNSDTNHIDGIISAYHFGSATTGSPVVLANSVYVPPSGVAVNGPAYDNDISFTGAPLYLAGGNTGLTVTPGGGNLGSGAVNTVTISTNGTTAGGNATLNFASTTGVVVGDSVTCGGVSSGVYPYSIVSSVTGTTAVMFEPAAIGGGLTGVASGQSCTFGIGVTGQAVAGTYTLTANSSTSFTLTAPAGGHTETKSVASGALGFTDMIIPWTGTASASDTWSVVVPTPSTLNRVRFVDKANSASDPHVEGNATASIPIGTTQFPYFATSGGYAAGAGNYGNAILPVASGLSSVALGGTQCRATGSYSVCIGGSGSIGSGFGSFATGQNATASGLDAFVAGGFGNTASGSTGYASGADATDRGRYGSQAFASGDFSAVGDSQVGRFVLRGTGASSGGTIRLTADAAAPGSANCVNIPNNTVFQIAIYTAGIDHTSVGSNTEWGAWNGLLTRGANAASTAIKMDTTPTPQTNGTVTGQAISATADTTQGCLNLTITHPTNTDTWNYVARVETVEVQ